MSKAKTKPRRNKNKGKTKPKKTKGNAKSIESFLRNTDHDAAYRIGAVYFELGRELRVAISYAQDNLLSHAIDTIARVLSYSPVLDTPPINDTWACIRTAVSLAKELLQQENGTLAVVLLELAIAIMEGSVILSSDSAATYAQPSWPEFVALVVQAQTTADLVGRCTLLGQLQDRLTDPNLNMNRSVKILRSILPPIITQAGQDTRTVKDMLLVLAHYIKLRCATNVKAVNS